MVRVVFTPSFKKRFSKIKDRALRERVVKQLEKLRDNPELGKPMRNTRKGTREVYVPPFRLSYKFINEESKVVILDLYHKDEQ